MDIESIREFVALLGESAVFMHFIDANPITPDDYASYQRLRPALNGSFFYQLDIDTEFYNEMDINRKKEIIRTLEQHLETPARNTKDLLPSHADLRNLLNQAYLDDIKNDTATQLEAEYYAGLLEFRTEIEHIADSIIAKVSEMRCYLNQRGTTKVSIRNIIQYEDKDKLLERLHKLIDGKGGADVGAVFLKAKLDGYITRTPTQKEFRSEFELIGSWQGISNYFNENSENALSKSNTITIF